MRRFFVVFFTSILLAGCGDTVADLKEAAAGINSKANEAASTINELFKSILRDVQWEYDDSGKTKLLKISGTWQDNGLFAHHSFSADQKERLKEHGKVEVILSFNNYKIDETKTQATLNMDGQPLIKEAGQETLHHFYKIYIK